MTERADVVATRTATVRVLAVDDHPAFLRTVEFVVTAAPGFELVGTSTTGSHALEAMVGSHAIDLVLLDVNLPDVSGIDVARRYAAAGGTARVVLMSTDELGDLPEDALDIGVAGFLPKERLTTASLRAAWADASD